MNCNARLLPCVHVERRPSLQLDILVGRLWCIGLSGPVDVEAHLALDQLDAVDGGGGHGGLLGRDGGGHGDADTFSKKRTDVYRELNDVFGYNLRII